MVWGGIVGQRVSSANIHAVVNKETWTTWKPDFIVLHNTAAPSLASRPIGLTKKHIDNLEKYYRYDRNWHSGPHFFVDDAGIWLFSPMTKPGTHSPSWNNMSIGIEMLGDYAVEPFITGRGAAVRRNTIALMAALNNKLGFTAESFRYHVTDPQTTHDCPGKNARDDRAAFVVDIKLEMLLNHKRTIIQEDTKPIEQLSLPIIGALPPWGEWNKDDK